MVYLDENVSVVVAEMLRAAGFRAQTTVEAGLLGASDEEQLAFACAHRMVFLTHNRADFEALHDRYMEEGREHWGIIIAGQRSPRTIVNRVSDVLNSYAADELRGLILHV